MRRHLSFANLTAVLALAVALSGTAYAASLPKNSVASKQIKNETVKGKDLKNGSVTGADVLEGSLSRVPDAAALGGVPAGGYAKGALQTTGTFTGAAPLELAVPGYGTFRLHCTPNGASLDDDEMGYAFSVSAIGAQVHSEATIVVGPDNVNSSSTVYAVDALSATVAADGDRASVDAVHLAVDGSKAIRIRASGWDPTDAMCAGWISAQVLK